MKLAIEATAAKSDRPVVAALDALLAEFERFFASHFPLKGLDRGNELPNTISFE